MTSCLTDDVLTFRMRYIAGEKAERDGDGKTKPYVKNSITPPTINSRTTTAKLSMPYSTGRTIKWPVSCARKKAKLKKNMHWILYAPNHVRRISNPPV